MRFFVWVLSFFPEKWLELALRKRPNVFIVNVIHGDELMAMSKMMLDLEAKKKIDGGFYHGDVH